MNVLKAVAQETKCFVLGIDHFGKNLEAGTRGASSKEASVDVVLACLGDKQLSGSVTNTRLAVRKQRGGKQGQEYPFTLRIVEFPEKDEDGDPITTMVVDWLPPGSMDAAPTSDDPWAKPKRQDQRTAALRLKRVLMTILAEQGVDHPIPPDGPVVRMVDQKLVRKAFYGCTPADGTPEQQGRFRRQKDPRPWDCAATNYTTDGLTRPWLGLVWLNPPFDRYQVAQWIARLARHGNGIALLHARTETGWFEPCWRRASGIFFLARRIRFCRPDGSTQPANSGAPPCLILFGATAMERLQAAKMQGILLREWSLSGFEERGQTEARASLVRADDI